MDDSYVNGILYLAKLKMGLPVDCQPGTVSVHVAFGDQQCELTYEELKTKRLNLFEDETKDVNSNSCKKFQNSNQTQPMDLSIKESSNQVETKKCKPTSLDHVKIEKCEYEGTTNDSFSNESEVPDNPTDEQVTSEYYASTESNDSSYPCKQESEPDSSKASVGEMEAIPKQISSAAENGIGDGSIKIEEKNVEDPVVEFAPHNSNSSENYYAADMRKRCYWCHELVYHRAWNCPKRRFGRDKNEKTQWSSLYSHPKWKPHYKPNSNFRRSNPFYNAGSNFGQNETPTKRGTFKSVMEMFQNTQREAKSRSPAIKWKSKKASTEADSRHKVFFQGQWYTNRIAADAESFLNKKEEVRLQIKKEHRNLDEGFEDVQLVFSDDEHSNENPTFAYNKNFKDEDNNPGGSSASLSTAA